MTNSWLLKTEPSTYSWGDLVRETRTVWDGVSNAAALINLRAMQAGDEALIYHSGEDRAIVGIARIARGAYPDPKLSDPKRVVVEVEAVRQLAEPVSLAEVKADKRLASSPWSGSAACLACRYPPSTARSCEGWESNSYRFIFGYAKVSRFAPP